MKRGFLPLYRILLLLSAFFFLLWVSNLLGDPIDLLSSSGDFFSGLLWGLLGIYCAEELLRYSGWYRRSMEVVKRGELPETPDTRPFQRVMLILILLCFLIWGAEFILNSDGPQRLIGVTIMVWLPLLSLILYGVREGLKRIRLPGALNRVMTTAVCFLTTLGILALLTGGVFAGYSSGFFENKDEEGSIIRMIRKAELPLTAETLGLGAGIDIKEFTGTLSSLLGRLSLRQYPRDGTSDRPTLTYTIVPVRQQSLYDLWKDCLLGDRGAGEADPTEWGRWRRSALMTGRMGGSRICSVTRDCWF